MYRVILPFTAALAVSTAMLNPAHAVEVYLFKGAGDFSFVNENLHFSRGLDRIADQLNSDGIHAKVRRFGATGDALRDIRQRKPESVAFIGHSMGALASLSMARQMREEGIRVAYLGLIDIPGPVGVAGDNVEWAENYYSIYPVYGRLTNADTHPNAHNIHVFGQIHTTLDDSRKVREGMLGALRKIHESEQQQSPDTETLMVQNTVPLDSGYTLSTPQAQSTQLPPIEPEQYAIQPITTAQTNVQPVQQPVQVVVAGASNAATGMEPIALPSVQSQYPQGTVQVQQPQVIQPIDPTTTASVEERPVDRVVSKVKQGGRWIANKARGLVNRINSRREARAKSYER